MAKYQAAETANLETIEAKLAAAEREYAIASRDAPAAALRVHLAEAHDPADLALIGRVAELEKELSSLRLAQQAARQAQAERQQAQRAADDAAARRAFAQHCGRIEKAVLKAASAAEVLARSFSDMVDARRAALACAPAEIRHSGDLDYRLSDERLGRMILVEIGRGLRAIGVQPPRVLTHFSGEFERNGRVVPMTEILGSVLQSVKTPSVASVPAEEAPASVAAPSAGAGAPPSATDTVPEPTRLNIVTLEKVG